MTKQVFLQPIYDDLWWITILVVVGIILYLIFGAAMRDPKSPQVEPQSASESRKSRISRTIRELSERIQEETGFPLVIYSAPKREPTFRIRFHVTGAPAIASGFGIPTLDPITGDIFYRHHYYLGGYWEWANHFTPLQTGNTDWDGWTPDELA